MIKQNELFANQKLYLNSFKANLVNEQQNQLKLVDKKEEQQNELIKQIKEEIARIKLLNEKQNINYKKNEDETNKLKEEIAKLKSKINTNQPTVRNEMQKIEEGQKKQADAPMNGGKKRHLLNKKNVPNQLSPQNIRNVNQPMNNPNLIQRFNGKDEPDQRPYMIPIPFNQLEVIPIMKKALSDDDPLRNSLYGGIKIFTSSNDNNSPDDEFESMKRFPFSPICRMNVNPNRSIVPFCSYAASGHNCCMTQKCYQCITCNLVNDLAICEVCADRCHKGHDLRCYGVGRGCFCDCLEKNKCKCFPISSKLTCTHLLGLSKEPMYNCDQCHRTICQNCAVKNHRGHYLTFLGEVEGKDCQDFQKHYI